LKKADFVYTDRRRVSFRYSNWEEARFWISINIFLS
jgi:hypothetical protein